MKQPAWQNPRYSHLLQRIQLLHHLNEVPQAPQSNPLPTAGANNFTGRRCLTLKHEKDLAEMFAYIAAITDNPKRVAAVCLEEHLEEPSLRVCLAINHGEAAQLHKGLEAVAKVLENIANQVSHTKAEVTSLLNAIVTINRNRILVRLRSRHGHSQRSFKSNEDSRIRRTYVTHLRTHLIQYLELARLLPCSEAGSNILQLGKDIQSSVNVLESMPPLVVASAPGMELLSELTDICERLSVRLLSSPRLDKAKDVPVDQCLDACTKIISRIGEYSAIARRLATAARRYPIFRSVRIFGVEQAAAITKAQQLDPFMFDTLRQYVNTEKKPKLKQYFGVGDFNAIQQSLSQHRYAKHPVHAEIQLLAHYELNSVEVLPRVICSCKDACYLCQKFLHLHGRFYTPKTHGRLYEKWALPAALSKLKGPDLSRMRTITDAFMDDVDASIKSLLRRRVRALGCPPESAVPSVVSWTATEKSDISINAITPEERVSERLGALDEAEVGSPKASINHIDAEIPTMLGQPESVPGQKELVHGEMANKADGESTLRGNSPANHATAQEVHARRNRPLDKSISSLWRSLGITVLTRPQLRTARAYQNTAGIVTMTNNKSVTRQLSPSLPILQVIAGNEIMVYLHYSDDVFLGEGSATSTTYPSNYWVSLELHDSRADDQLEELPVVLLETMEGGMERTLRIADQPWTGAFCITGKGQSLTVRYYLDADG